MATPVVTPDPWQQMESLQSVRAGLSPDHISALIHQIELMQQQMQADREQTAVQLNTQQIELFRVTMHMQMQMQMLQAPPPISPHWHPRKCRKGLRDRLRQRRKWASSSSNCAGQQLSSCDGVADVDAQEWEMTDDQDRAIATWHTSEEGAVFASVSYESSPLFPTSSDCSAVNEHEEAKDRAAIEQGDLITQRGMATDVTLRCRQTERDVAIKRAETAEQKCTRSEAERPLEQRDSTQFAEKSDIERNTAIQRDVLLVTRRATAEDRVEILRGELARAKEGERMAMHEKESAEQAVAAVIEQLVAKEDERRIASESADLAHQHAENAIKRAKVLEERLERCANEALEKCMAADKERTHAIQRSKVLALEHGESIQRTEALAGDLVTTRAALLAAKESSDAATSCAEAAERACKAMQEQLAHKEMEHCVTSERAVAAEVACALANQRLDSEVDTREKALRRAELAEAQREQCAADALERCTVAKRERDDAIQQAKARSSERDVANQRMNTAEEAVALIQRQLTDKQGEVEAASGNATHLRRRAHVAERNREALEEAMAAQVARCNCAEMELATAQARILELQATQPQPLSIVSDILTFQDTQWMDMKINLLVKVLRVRDITDFGFWDCRLKSEVKVPFRSVVVGDTSGRISLMATDEQLEKLQVGSLVVLRGAMACCHAGGQRSLGLTTAFVDPYRGTAEIDEVGGVNLTAAVSIRCD